MSSTQSRPDWIRLKPRCAAVPNWDFWGRTAASPLWRWVAVAFRVEPLAIFGTTHSEMPPDFYGRGERFDRFMEALDLGSSAIRARQLPSLTRARDGGEWSEVRALEFWYWWHSNEWEVPPEIQEGLRRQVKFELRSRGQELSDLEDSKADVVQEQDRVYTWLSILEYLGERFQRKHLLQRTVRNWLKQQGIPLRKHGNRVYMLKSDLNRVAPPVSSR